MKKYKKYTKFRYIRYDMSRLHKLKIKLFHSKYKEYLRSYSGVFDMYEKEQNIFFESVMFLEKNSSLKSNLLYTFHWYEAFINLFVSYKDEFKLSNDDVSELNLSVDELGIALKHFASWYYESAHVHLRVVMEFIIKMFFKKLVSKKEEKDFLKHKKEKYWNNKLSIEDKMKLCIKNGDFPWETVDVWWFVYNTKDFFSIYKMKSIYKQLSHVVHNWNKNKVIQFRKDDFKWWIDLSVQVIEILWKILFLCIWKTVKKYRANRYEYAEDIPENYAKPIRWLIVR